MVVMQNLTRKKALGTGPNSAVQAEYALDGNVLITVLKVWASTFYCTCGVHVSWKDICMYGQPDLRACISHLQVARKSVTESMRQLSDVA